MSTEEARLDSCTTQPVGVGEGGRARLRDASATDVGAVHRLLREAGLPVEGVDESSMYRTSVLMEGDTVLGCASVEVHGRIGLLRSVVVAAEIRGQQRGRELVTDRVEWARSHGLEALVLFTETAPGFFERLGFEHVARENLPVEIEGSAEFGLCPLSSKSMRLELPSDVRSRIEAPSKGGQA